MVSLSKWTVFYEFLRNFTFVSQFIVEKIRSVIHCQTDLWNKRKNLQQLNLYHCIVQNLRLVRIINGMITSFCEKTRVKVVQKRNSMKINSISLYLSKCNEFRFEISWKRMRGCWFEKQLKWLHICAGYDEVRKCVRKVCRNWLSWFVILIFCKKNFVQWLFESFWVKIAQFFLLSTQLPIKFIMIQGNRYHFQRKKC